MTSTIMYARRIPKWKIEEVEELYKLFKGYPAFIIADLQGFPTNQLQRLRKKLRKHAVFRVSKNKLILLAMKKAGINVSLFEKVLTGQNLIIFTKLNVFELVNLLEKHRSKTYYRPGDKAEQEIVIPEGDTGLPPGPILSTFGKLKIPTRVQGNTVVVTRDTVVAKPGDVISEELASLLQKLDMPLKEVILKTKIAYDHGVLVPGDRLKLDLEEYSELLAKAELEALFVGMEIVWPEPKIIEAVLAKAYREAKAIAVEAGFIAPDTIKDLMEAAIARAYVLALEVKKQGVDLGVELAVAKAEAVEEEKKEEEKPAEEEEEKEGVSEEELAEGLGALFG
ncbi:MAG: 50S ribosomal protein L10 [Thermoprotei archaeon]|nr:MAG: 50S ribosomal protein L10 [Thermoprotei archaeon]